MEALYGVHVAGRPHERDAAEAAANTLSGFGTPGMTYEVVMAIEQAMEVGYLLAMDDVSAGRVDVEVDG